MPSSTCSCPASTLFIYIIHHIVYRLPSWILCTCNIAIRLKINLNAQRAQLFSSYFSSSYRKRKNVLFSDELHVRRLGGRDIVTIIILFRTRKCSTMFFRYIAVYSDAVERAKSVFRSFLIKYANGGRVYDGGEAGCHSWCTRSIEIFYSAVLFSLRMPVLSTIIYVQKWTNTVC